MPRPRISPPISHTDIDHPWVAVHEISSQSGPCGDMLLAPRLRNTFRCLRIACRRSKFMIAAPVLPF